MKLSIIVPAYNEEKRLPKTLFSIDDYLKKQPYDYEILVVSDGSKDNTANIASELKSKIQKLKVIDNRKNHGKGYVVQQGMLEARGEYRLFTDADNSTSIDQVEKMWPWFEKGFDVVIGSRDIKGAVLDPPQPWQRRLVGDIFNILVQFFAGLFGIWDTQCGFKCFNAKAVENIFPKMKMNGFAFDVEALVLAKKNDYKIKEVPIIWKNDLESKVKLRNVFNMFLDILKIRKNLILGKYVSKK